jgi:hypothetical protein
MGGVATVGSVKGPGRPESRGQSRTLTAPALNPSGLNTIVVVVLGFRSPGGVVWPTDFGGCGSGTEAAPECVVAAVTANMWTGTEGSVAALYADTFNGFSFYRPDAVRGRIWWCVLRGRSLGTAMGGNPYATATRGPGPGGPEQVAGLLAA